MMTTNKIKNYKHLFFDLDNTLWDFEKNSHLAMKTTFESFNIGIQNVEYEAFFETYSRLNHLLWKEYRNNKISKKELIIKRFQQTFNEFHVSGIDPQKMNSFYLDEMPKQTHLKEGVKDLLQLLKKKQYKLYIITNGFVEVQQKKLENSGLIQFFTKIYISEKIKSPKPRHEIFEYAIKSANAKKTESLMIGDDWEADIIGAHQFGMDAVYLTTNRNCDVKMNTEKNTNGNKIYCINEIPGLLKFL